MGCSPVVDLVNLVFGLDVKGEESALTLLDDLLLLGRKACIPVREEIVTSEGEIRDQCVLMLLVVILVVSL